MKTAELKTWRPFPTTECPKCGCLEALVLTKSKKEYFVYDGEAAKCFNCGHTGYVSVEDSECADVIWEGQP